MTYRSCSNCVRRPKIWSQDIIVFVCKKALNLELNVFEFKVT
jgi:hypothetical protein